MIESAARPNKTITLETDAAWLKESGNAPTNTLAVHVTSLNNASARPNAYSTCVAPATLVREGQCTSHPQKHLHEPIKNRQQNWHLPTAKGAVRSKLGNREKNSPFLR